MRRALLFDFDGLIVDTETTWARTLIGVLAEDGIQLALTDVARLIGVAGREFEREWRSFVDTYLGPRFDEAALRTKLRPLIDAAIVDLEVLPGVGVLMSDARTELWKVGLATGTRRVDLLPRIELLGLGSAFDEIVTSEDVARGKPAPDIYLELARRLAVAPKDCVVLEDSSHGARAALAAGMTVIVCPCEATGAHEFPEGVRRVSSLEEVEFRAL